MCKAALHFRSVLLRWLKYLTSYINLIFYKLMKIILSSTIKHLWARDCKGIKFNNVH